MITLLKSNIVGARDVVSIMYLELLFDVKTELPDKFYQINGKNFLIANGSLAIKTFINDKNENDTIVYKYNNGKWIKTADKYTGIITSISTITENGKYSIGSNNTIGTNNIDVNVADIPSVLGEKTITANGTYNAIDDDVEGYSKVIANVTSKPQRITFPTSIYKDSSGTKRAYDGQLLFSNDGIYDLIYNAGNEYACTILANPLKKVPEVPYETRINYPNCVVFTPANDFDGFYLENSKINPSGDTITAGDNKWYVAIFNWTHIYDFPDNFTVYKMSNTSITPVNIWYFH